MAINWNKEQPAPKAIWSIVKRNFPRARFLGIYVKRNIAGTTKPSSHGEGRALDIGLLVKWPWEKEIGDGLFKIFIDNAKELGLDYAIWNRQIWSTSKGGPRRYSGQSPHTDHIHLTFSKSGSQKNKFPKTELAISVFSSGLSDLAGHRKKVG
ncbi:MAG: hypothetical protein OEY00_01025 [Gammaproteobacteria bacterium]|nr:hypothetical protein [Gammaproteobacteria bacterium]